MIGISRKGKMSIGIIARLSALGSQDVIIQISPMTHNRAEFVGTWRQIYPLGANRGPAPHEIPADIVQDYIEACNVLPIQGLRGRTGG
jgi:hypothetical protein